MTKAIPLSIRGASGLFTLVDDCDVAFCEARRIFIGNAGKYPTVTLWRDDEKHVIALHRAILEMWPGDSRIVDHINGDRFDNRRANLRVVGSKENAANRKTSARNLAGLKGVTTFDSGYGAKISGRYLGRFRSPQDAALAYDDAARAAFGPFAALNFPKPGETSCHRPTTSPHARSA